MPQIICPGTHVDVTTTGCSGRMLCVHVNVNFSTHKIDSIWVINDQNQTLQIQSHEFKTAPIKKNSIIQILSPKPEGAFRVLAKVEDDMLLIQDTKSHEIRFLDSVKGMYSVLKI